jgi:hypothetical protein
MAGNLTGLHVFANDVSPEPLSLLDTNYSALNAAFNALLNYSNYYVDSGIANALAITVTANQTVSYGDGLLLQIQVAATNTGATTLNVNGIGPKNVVDQAGNALPAGILLAASYITVIYRATANNFQLLDGGQFSTSTVGGNPTAQVGLAAINGSAVTFMRSDAAPALNVSIAPTWTGLHTFTKTVTISPTSGLVGLTINGAANQYAAQLIGSSTAGQSFGLSIAAGTNATDRAVDVENQGSSVVFFRIFGDGHGLLGPSSSLGLSWTAGGAFTLAVPSSGLALLVNGAANNYAVQATGSSTSGQSFGLTVVGGTTSADAALLVLNQAQTITFCKIFGDGHGTLGPSATSGLSWTAGGNIVIAQPSGGVPVTINGTSGAGGYFSASNNANASTTSDIANSSAGTAAAAAYRVSNSTNTLQLGMTSTGYSGSYVSNAPAGQIGFLIQGGGVPLLLGANSNVYFQITSGGALQGYGPTAAAFVDMTADTGTFTITYTGFTATITGTAVWSRSGNQVLLFLPVATGTSNAVTMTATGIPAAIAPTRAQVTNFVSGENNTVVQSLSCRVDVANTLSFGTGAAGVVGGFTAAGTKGINAGSTIQYLLN